MTRSALQYQKRKRLRSLGWPAPRYAPSQSLVHQYPLDKPVQELIVGEGTPSPDRVTLPDWSPPAEQ